MLRVPISIVLIFPFVLFAQEHDATLLGTGYLNLDVGQGSIGYGVHATATAFYLSGTTYDEQGAMQLVVLARNTDGTAMTSFGTNGQLLIEEPGATWSNALVKSSPDGTIKLFTTLSNGAAQIVKIYSVTGSGTIEGSFGSGGASIIDLGDLDLLYDVHMFTDGRMAVLTYTIGYGAAVTLLGPNGAIVTGYGDNGTAQLPSGVFAMSLAPSSDGGLWIGGTQWTGSDNDSWIGLLDGNGAFNGSFSADGQSTIDLDPHLFDGTSDIITTLAPHPAGGHLALVNIYGDAIGYGLYRLARTDAQGQLVPGFGSAGVIDVLSPDFVNLLPSMILEPDGRIMLCVGTSGSLELEKRDNNGQPIEDWGTNGTASLSVADRQQYSMSRAVEDPQGRIVTIGTARIADEYTIVVDRVTNDLQTGIGPQDNGTLGLMAYPVPFHTELTVRAEEPIRRLEVLDMAGRSVRTETPNSTLATLDVRMLDPGVYLVKAFGDSRSTTRKIIKQ